MSKGFAMRLNTIYDILVKVTYPSPSISRRPIKATKNSWAMKLHRSKLKLDTTNGHQFKEKKKKKNAINNLRSEWRFTRVVRVASNIANSEINWTDERRLFITGARSSSWNYHSPVSYETAKSQEKSVVSRARETLPRIRPWLMDRDEQRASGNPWNIFIISLHLRVIVHGVFNGKQGLLGPYWPFRNHSISFPPRVEYNIDLVT